MTYISANHAVEPEMTECRVPFVPPVPHEDKRDRWDKDKKKGAPLHLCGEAPKISKSSPRIRRSGTKASYAKLAVINGIRNGSSVIYLSFMNRFSGSSGILALAF